MLESCPPSFQTFSASVLKTQRSLWNIHAMLLLNKTYCVGLAALSLTDLGFCAGLNSLCWKEANCMEAANITHSCPPLGTPYHSIFLRATSPKYMLLWPFAAVGQVHTPCFIEVDSKPCLSQLAICTTWSKVIVWWPAMIGSRCKLLAAPLESWKEAAYISSFWLDLWKYSVWPSVVTGWPKERANQRL